MRLTTATPLAVLAVLAALTGCGSSSSSSSSSHAPTPRAADFPAVHGQTVRQLVAPLPQGPVFAASVSVFRVGENRVGFALFTASRKQITTAEAALYTTDASGHAIEGGPYLAHEESLAVDPRFESQTVKADPDAAHSVYVAQVPFPHAGRQQLVALVRLGGKLQFAGGTATDVGAPGAPPDVGQAAIRVHTPTVGQVGLAHVSAIDTRVPPAPNLERVDLASVLGRKPAVLLFATPELCQSRVCGPVTDIEDQVASEFGSRAAFIHMEIYKDNTVSKGFRPQVTAWHLPSEPWLFVIDRRGRIAERIEGAFSVAELRAAVQKVV